MDIYMYKYIHTHRETHTNLGSVSVFISRTYIIDEPCHQDELWMSHVTRMNVTCRAYDSTLTHI